MADVLGDLPQHVQQHELRRRVSGIAPGGGGLGAGIANANSSVVTVA